MSKGVISAVLSLIAIVALAAAPAWSAQRALTKQNCEGAGGTFSSNRGVKYCVRVASVFTEEGTPQSNEAFVPVDAISSWRWIGSYRYDTTFAQLLTESQIGNREVLSSSEDVEIGQDLVLLGCMKWQRVDSVGGIVLETAEEQHLQADCAALGLYPTA